MTVWQWDDLTGTVGVDQPQKQDCAFAYDPINGYGILSGGDQGISPSTHYKFDVPTRQWTEFTSAVFSGRATPIHFWDPVNERITHGFGNTVAPWPNDLFYWDHATSAWINIVQTGAPPDGGGRACCVDSSRGWLVQFGGQNTATETWVLDLSTFVWTEITGALTGNPGLDMTEPIHKAMGMVHVPAIDKHFLFGGQRNTGQFYDKVWVLDLVALTWTDITALITEVPNGYSRPFHPGWPPMYLGMDIANAKILKIGGQSGDATDPQADVWQFDPSTYVAEYIVCSGDPTPGYPLSIGPRGTTRSQSGIYVLSEDAIYIACGRLGTGAVSDVTWVLGVPPVTGPLVTPIDPTKSQSGVSKASSINFTLTSNVSIENPWTVEIDRGGADGFELALTYNGAAVFEPLFQGPDSMITILANGFDITIDPKSFFQPSQSVIVRVTAEDNLGQQATVA